MNENRLSFDVEKRHERHESNEGHNVLANLSEILEKQLSLGLLSGKSIDNSHHWIGFTKFDVHALKDTN